MVVPLWRGNTSNEQHHLGSGAPYAGQGVSAVGSVPHDLLFRCLFGSGEYRLRRVDHEQGSGVLGLGIRVCRGHLLCQLFPVRGTLEFGSGAVWRAALGIASSTLLDDPVLKMVALSVSAFGMFAVLPVFWTLPTAFLSGASAAAGMAAINSLGTTAGFAGGYAMGAIKDATGSFTGGLLLIAALAVMAMVVVL